MRAFHFFPSSKVLNPEEKRYIAGRSWACAKSPTGAHHSIAAREDGAPYICRHCGRTRIKDTNNPTWGREGLANAPER